MAIISDLGVLSESHYLSDDSALKSCRLEAFCVRVVSMDHDVVQPRTWCRNSACFQDPSGHPTASSYFSCNSVFCKVSLFILACFGTMPPIKKYHAKH